MADFNIDITTPAPFVIEFATVGPQGPSGSGGGGTITTANMLYVDANGSDSTGTVDRLDLPYLTPLAAQTAASSGDTIVVRPGAYSGGALGGKAGVNWFWEPGSSYTNSTNNGIVWDFATGTYNVAGHGKFYQTSGSNGNCVFAQSGRTGNFEADYVESVGGSLVLRDSCNVRVRHAKSTSYDVILASPAVTTAIMDIEVGVVDAGSNPITLEGAATTVKPITIRVGNIIVAGDYLVLEESTALQNATIFIGDSVKNGVEAPESAIYSDVSSEVSIVFANWRYSPLPANDGSSTTYKIFVINNHVHDASEITTGTVDPARLGSGTSITTKFLRGDSTWQTIAGGGDALTTNPLSQFAATTSAQLRGVISDETGSGVAVFNDAPNLIRPTFTASSTARSTTNLGVGVAPTSPIDGDLWTDSTGLFYRIATGSTLRVADKAIGLSQFGSTTSAELRGVLSDETGTGLAYFQGGDIGTPSAGVLSSCTGYVVGNISGLGTGVATALGIAIGSAGAPVTFNGALGTPSSGTVTNLTGTASININGTVGATTPAAGTFTTVVAGSATSILVGTAGSAVGSVGFRNATSGTITLQPTTGALGTITITLPATTGTVYVTGGTDVSVADGGTGRSTSTTAYGLIAAGTTATGAHQTLPAGLTTQVLVGGGASALPVWTTATGTGAPVREGSPTLSGTATVANIAASGIVRVTETTYTPSGTTQTIPLDSGNHQTLSLASTTGNPTITLTVPSSSAAGTLILVQHGTTPRSITWTPSSGTILWAGGAPTFSGDAAGSTRVISWRWSSATSRLFLAATDVAV